MNDLGPLKNILTLGLKSWNYALYSGGTVAPSAAAFKGPMSTDSSRKKYWFASYSRGHTYLM